MDRKAYLFFQSLPNPPHQCQHGESYEVSRSLRDKFPAKITKKTTKMKKTSQKSFKPVFAELKKKHHIFSPNNKHTLLVYAFIIFTNIDEKKKCRR